MAGESDFQKRMPSVERKIKDIGPEDIRVSIIGAVIDSQEGRIVVDDGTGKVEVSFDRPVNAANGMVARVLGRVMHMDEGVEIQGDALQDMSGMDMELRRVVDSLHKA